MRFGAAWDFSDVNRTRTLKAVNKNLMNKLGEIPNAASTPQAGRATQDEDGFN